MKERLLLLLEGTECEKMVCENFPVILRKLPLPPSLVGPTHKTLVSEKTSVRNVGKEASLPSLVTLTVLRVSHEHPQTRKYISVHTFHLNIVTTHEHIRDMTVIHY